MSKLSFFKPTALAAALALTLAVPAVASAQDHMDEPHPHQQLHQPDSSEPKVSKDNAIKPHEHGGTADADNQDSADSQTGNREAGNAESKSGSSGKPALYNASKYRDAAGNHPTASADHEHQHSADTSKDQADKQQSAAVKQDGSADKQDASDNEYKATAEHQHKSDEHDHASMEHDHAAHEHHHMSDNGSAMGDTEAKEGDDEENKSRFTLKTTRKVSVDDCWIRLMPEESPSSMYFEIKNEDDEDVALTAIDAYGFSHAMLHRSFRDKDGNSTMEDVESVEIPTGGSVEFKPGSYHVMLMKPASDLKTGEAIKVTFQLSNHKKFDGSCEVKSPKAQSYDDE